MTHILALLGSGISTGNTSRLLDAAIRGAEEAGCTVERIDIPAQKISPCVQSYGCMFENSCAIDDDAGKIVNKLKKCDGVIVATPIMTYGIPGALKCFMDRCQPFYMAANRGTPFVKKEQAKKRRALFISISGMNTPDVFDGARATMKAWCSIISVRYFDELLQNDMDTLQRVENKPELVDAAFAKGKALGEILVRESDK